MTNKVKKKKKKRSTGKVSNHTHPPKNIYIIKVASSSVLLWLQEIRREIQATHVERSWMMRYQLEKKPLGEVQDYN